VLACVFAFGGAQAAPRQTERSKQKAAAEAARVGIQQKLSALKKDISRTESEKEDAADELSESEYPDEADQDEEAGAPPINASRASWWPGRLHLRCSS